MLQRIAEMTRRRRKGQGIGKKFMEYYPFIKKVIKNIIRKDFFICEPFITVTNNTNSFITRIAKIPRRRRKCQGHGKIHKILFLDQKKTTKILNENFFYLDNKKIYINSIL